MNRSLPLNGSIPSAEALDKATERRIDSALERKPEQAIPVDFAAKMAARASAIPLRRRASSVRIGRSIAWISTAVLAIALFAIAPHTTPSLSSVRFDAEILLLAELAGLGWWLARSMNERSST
jgi:hypothetical protein